MTTRHERIAAHAASVREASEVLRDANLRLRSELAEQRLTREDAVARLVPPELSTSREPS